MLRRRGLSINGIGGFARNIADNAVTPGGVTGISYDFIGQKA
jgi:hypothetical protein